MIARDPASVLSDLLQMEQRSLAHRICESTVFVSRLALDDLRLIRRLAKASEQHAALLAELIMDLGHGLPPRGRPDAASADLHYLDVRTVLPRLVADEEALVEGYASAARQLADHTPAGALVARILTNHRENLAALQQASEPTAGPLS